jgi:hypothetical protein
MPTVAALVPCVLLQEEWFADPEAVQVKVGLVDEQPSTRRKEVRQAVPRWNTCCFYAAVELPQPPLSQPLWLVIRGSKGLLQPLLPALLSCALSLLHCTASSALCLLQEVCKICFESFSVQDMACARCKHYYCKVNSGGGCLSSLCPSHAASVGCAPAVLPSRAVPAAVACLRLLLPAGLLARLHPHLH